MPPTPSGCRRRRGRSRRRSEAGRRCFVRCRVGRQLAKVVHAKFECHSCHFSRLKFKPSFRARALRGAVGVDDGEVLVSMSVSDSQVPRINEAVGHPKVNPGAASRGDR